MPNPVHKRRLERLGLLEEEEAPKVEEKEEIIEPEVIEPDDDDVFTREELEAMSKAELVELAKSLELDSSGTKADIIDRILGF